MAGISFNEFVNGGNSKKSGYLKGISAADFVNNNFKKKTSPAVDFSQYDPEILSGLKQDDSTWTYDLFDAEDMRRKAQGLMPKSLADDYDLDDPIDKYLYDQGYVSRDKFSKGYQQGEKNKIARANFSSEVNKKTEEKIAATERAEWTEGFERNIFNETFEELRKSDSYKNLIKSDDADVYFNAYAKNSMQNKLAAQDDEDVQNALVNRAAVSDSVGLGSVGLPQVSAPTRASRTAELVRRLGGDGGQKGWAAPSIDKMIANVKDEKTAAEQEKKASEQKSKAEILKNAAQYSADSETRLREIDDRIKAISRLLEREQGVQKTYIAPDKRNAQLQERSAAQIERNALQQERESIIAARNASKVAGFYQLAKNADFKENNAYDPAKVKQEGVLYSFINGIDPVKTSMLVPMGVNMPSTTSDPDYAFAYMNDEERGIYNYLINTNGDDKEFLEAMRPYLNLRMREDVEAQAESYAQEKPVLSSLETVVTSPISAIEGLIGLGKTGINAISGRDTDPNDPVFQHTRRNETIRNTVANTIKAENRGFVGDALSMIYQTGMSMGDTAVRLPMGAAGLGVAGLSAAASAMDDALSRGASSGQAFASGIASGAAEIVFEKVSLDELIDISRAGNIRDVVKNILKQGGVEASEEAFTELANAISDTAIMADKSNYEIAVRDYMQQGMDEYAARFKASMDVFSDTLNSAIGGFLSGVGFGMGGSAYSAAQTAVIGANIDAQAQIDQGLTMTADTEAYKLAYKLAQRETPSAMQTGQLFIENQNALAAGARANFEADVRATGIEEADVLRALYFYDKLAEGKNISPRAARKFTKLQESINTANARRAEIEADLGVTRLELKTKLDQIYTAMTDAVAQGDGNAFNKAKARYMAEYQIVQAKISAAQMKADNQKAEASRKARNAVDEMADAATAEEIKEQEAPNGENQNHTPTSREYNDGEQRTGQPAGDAAPRVAGYAEGSQESIGRDSQNAAQEGLTATPEAEAQIAGSAEGNQESVGRNSQNAAKRGLTATAEAEAALELHREIVKRATGRSVNSRIVNEVSEQEAEVLDTIKSITGRDAFLYESDDSYGDGFAKDGQIFLRVNGSSHLAFLSGHEFAHVDSRLVVAGMGVTENMAKNEIDAYAELRRAEVGEDGADIQRELISDMFGRMMFEVATGRTAGKNFGISQYTIDRFYDEFLEALSPELETGGYIGEAASAVADAMNAGGIEYSRQKNTKHQQTSRQKSTRLQPYLQEGLRPDNISAPAATEILGIVDNITALPESVKNSLKALALAHESVETGIPVEGSKKAINADNLIGNLAAIGEKIPGAFKRNTPSGASIYTKNGNNTLRVSDHHARAENFKTSGESASIVLRAEKSKNRFFNSAERDVIELVFGRKYLNDNPDALLRLIRDMANFLVTGEYHDSAGAKAYNFSGSKEFIESAKARMRRDTQNRLEFSRLTFSDSDAYAGKDGKVMEYSYAMPTDKERVKKGGKDAFLKALSPELEGGGYIGEAASAVADAMNAGGIEYSKQKNTKHQQTSRQNSTRLRPYPQEGIKSDDMSVLAATEILGIETNITALDENVKENIRILALAHESARTEAPIDDGKKAVSANNLAGYLNAMGEKTPGTFGRSNETGASVYAGTGSNTLRISDHYANAENFSTPDENASIVLRVGKAKNAFNPSSGHDVIELVFGRKFLNNDKESFLALIRDMANFLVTGEYHDNVGAKNYNFSGSEEFIETAKARMAQDAQNRLEYSRITFSDPDAYVDKDGKVMEYSHAMPTVKERVKKGGKDAFLKALSPELESGGYIGETASAVADAMNAGGIEYSRTQTNLIMPFSNVTARQLESMSDAERAAELTHSMIAATVVDTNEVDAVYDLLKTPETKLSASEAMSIIKSLAEKFKAFGIYKNQNVEVEFQFTGRGVSESSHQQYKRKKTVRDQARLLPVIKNVIEGAVPVETHSDLKTERLKRVYVLLSAFVENGNIVPVQMEIKEYKDSKTTSKLYVVVTLDNKKTGVVDAEISKEIQTVSRPVFNIKLADIIKEVNHLDDDFLMYLPDQMLNVEQRMAKWDAVDRRYLDAVKNGKDYEAAQRAKLAARNAGYNKEAYYAGELFNALSKERPGNNVQTKSGQRWFFAGDKETAYPYGVLKELAGQTPNIWKDADVKKPRYKGKLRHLYLKMKNPLTINAAYIENKDAFMAYVTQAEEDGNDGIVILNARDEQFHPGAEKSTVYMFRNPSQAKSADAITYDDEGRVIPLSDRFNKNSNDIRYSRLTFSDPDAYVDKDGKVMEYSHAMPTVKERVKKSGKDAFLKALSPELESGGYIGEAASAAADAMNAGGIEYSRTGDDRGEYSYSYLTAQAPMKVVKVPDLDAIFCDGRIKRERITELGIENAEKRAAGFDAQGVPYVINKYTGKKLRISGASVKHGLDGKFTRLSVNSRLGLVIGELAENAIPVNRLKTKNESIKKTYAMVAYGRSTSQDFIAILHVDETMEKVEDVEILVDRVHSLNGRIKKNTTDSTSQIDSMESHTGGSVPTISIRNLLDIVKELSPDVLSRDVLERYGTDKNIGGYYSGETLYSRLTFSDPDAYVDKDGKVMEYSHAMPTVKERVKKDGDRFYADVTVNGRKTRMTGNDKAALEAEIRDLKRKERMEHLSRPVQILREANRLFKSGVSVEGYAELCSETGQEYDVAVARALMGMQLRNGQSVGGQLSTAELNKILADSDKWKDKSAFAYGRETLVRNLEDIAPTREEGRKLVETYWQPIDHGVADMTRWMQKWSEQIAALKLNAEESAMVQLVGEGRVEGDILKNGLLYEDGAPMDEEKIQKAVETFRRFYAEALRMANDALVRNGYAPVRARENYFPHIDALAGELQSFINDIVRGGADALPTDISGITETFQPGKKWFRNFQQRLGDATDYDAVRGFQNYIDGIGQVIFLTDGIQRIRQLEKAIRTKYGMEDGNRWLEKSSLTGKEKTQHLSRFAAWLLEYGNQLAGKTTRIDRAIEDAFGRKGLSVLKWLKIRFGANAVGGNLSTALSNFIPLTQGLATMKKSAFLNGMRAAVSRQVRNDGLWKNSNFLTKRFGRPDALTVQRWKLGVNPKNVRIKGSIEAQKASQTLNWLFELVDRFTAETLVFGKYEEGLQQGLAAAEAMKRADEYAERTMAGRTVGSVPTLLNSKALGLFTQFQLEVNNQMSNIIKDIPRHYGDRKKIVFALLQLFIYGFLYNEINEKFLTGRRPAFDPINVLVEAVADFTNPDVKKGDALVNLGTNVLDQLPLGQLLTGGGRIPLASAIESASPMDAIVKTLNGDEGVGQAWKDFGTGLLYNFALPAGGGQVKKWVTGGKALLEGGRYYGDRLAYPVEASAGNIVSAALFGPSAVREGRKYYTQDGKTLSEKKTVAYREAVEKGVRPADAYEVLQNYGGATKAEKLTSLAESDVEESTRRLIAVAMGLELGDGRIKSQAKEAANDYLESKEQQYKSGKIAKADFETANRKTQDLLKRLMGIK